ncbi:hypothetical protein Smic_59270 [Streptomyces microflavus]|uniref:Cobalamin-independent synthase, Catalytic domain n=1 Tax=Streptomyces microflavus TaxID=1919 RepID=A0A7J0CXV5_STRMI|nr:hypothetical protein Smic_59270 [Streptomyces microflavus]
MPGGDAREAAKTVTGSFADGQGMPYLAELPARGPGADMTGRTIGMLVEMYGHVEPSGWRISDRPGRDTRRARSWLGEDLDALEEFTQGYEGLLKVQAVGPWTLAAGLELRGGEAMLGDPGACRDLAGSLAEGLRSHLAEVRRRMPGAEVVLQLDEPSLTAVLLGRVRSASGYRTYRAVDRQVVESALRDVLAVAGEDGTTIVHSCAPKCPSRCCAGPGWTESPSTSPSSRSVRRRRSGKRSKAAPSCSSAWCPPPTPPRGHCQTRAVASWGSGRCGAGWG